MTALYYECVLLLTIVSMLKIFIMKSFLLELHCNGPPVTTFLFRTSEVYNVHVHPSVCCISPYHFLVI